jgi:RimJ/RimL family protein N-acetyltransferase
MNTKFPDLLSQLETERLVVRPFRKGDGVAYYGVCLRNRQHLLPFEENNPARDVASMQEAELLARQFAGDWAGRRGFCFGAWEKESGSFAAQVYLRVVNWDLPEFEIGYFADVEHEGQGFVTEASRAVLRFAFEQLGAHRVGLRCDQTNSRSSRVAERCGLTLEGRLREKIKHTGRQGVSFTDELIYGMLQDDYFAQRLSGAHKK